MSAEVIQLFPQAPRSCWTCVSLISGPNASWCSEYQEQIIDEVAAASDCPLYESSED